MTSPSWVEKKESSISSPAAATSTPMMSILRSGLTRNCLRVMGATRFELFVDVEREEVVLGRALRETGFRGMGARRFS
ncbi:MAG: hypothetical protein ABFD24_02445 [Anaerolineaceae bacterium]